MACIGIMDGTKLAITLWAEPQETQICVQKNEHIFHSISHV